MNRRSDKKNQPKLFKAKTSNQLPIKIDELNELIEVTAEYMETHNAVVTRLWEIQYNIEKQRTELTNNQNHLDKNELAILSTNLKNLENLAQTFINNLNNNHSAEIINENLKKIEELYNKFYPQNKIDFNSPVNLKTLKLT